MAMTIEEHRHKFVNAWFSDAERSLITQLWRTVEETDYEESFPFDVNNIDCKDLLTRLSIEEIHKKTDERLAMQRQAYKNDVMAIALEEGLLYREEDEVASKPLTFENILKIESDKEGFFNLKLEIFETEKVKTSTSREWKAAMRKTESVLELFSLYHAGPPEPVVIGKINTSEDTSQDSAQS